MRLAQSHARLLDYQNAFEACKLSTDCSEIHVESKWEMARILLQLKRFEEALSWIEQDVRERNSNAETHRLHGDVLGWLDRDEEAVKAYSRCLQIAPANGKALSGRGMCLNDLGQLAEALTDCRKAYELGVRDSEFVDAISEMEAELRDENAAENGNGTNGFN